MIRSLTILIMSICPILAYAYDVPSHLEIIPLKHPTENGINISDLPDLEIQDHLLLTLRKTPSRNAACQEIQITDSVGKVRAFNVCVPDDTTED